LAFLVLLPALVGLDRPRGLADVREVRHWSYPEYTRVVVELTGAVRAEARWLPADVRAGRPDRIYFDLPGVWVGRRFDEPIPIADGLLEDVRVAQHTRRDTRVVVDLARYDHHRLFFLSSPERIVLDVYGRRGRGRAEAPAPGGPPSRLPLDLRPVETVVLDAGHGGEDPGAIGVGGLREKDVTLSVALELRRRLLDRGFQVVLTRDRDATLSLEERTARAEGAGGDVFVSIHANAARRRSAHGIETYFLDKSHERHSMRVASRENGVPASRLDDLQRTVAGLRISEVGEHSALLARTVHGELLRGVRRSHGAVADLGAKPGPFYVLFLSGMPSILIETGFLTNSGEARRLRSRYYRDVLAEHIARGLSRFRSEHATLLAGRPR
jgi:N-acetylmuramoyl-L-alanine amidase